MSSIEGRSRREPPQKAFLTDITEHFWDWFYCSLGPITCTLRYVLCSTLSLILLFGVMLFAVAICAPLIMDYAATVPQFALDQLCDNGLRYLTTTRSARILRLPNPCLTEPEAREDGLPGDITGVRAIARWGDTESDLLETRDNFASLSGDLSKQASLIKVQQELYVNGAELYALAKKHQKAHQKAEDRVSELYTSHRIFQREIVQDIEVVHESLEDRIKHYGRGGFGWHTVVEGWARWIPSLFSLTPYATVLDSLATFAEDHQPKAQKLIMLGDDVQQALLEFREARNEVSAQFAKEYTQWRSRCVVTETMWFGLRTMTTSGPESYCQPRDLGNLKDVLEDEYEWLEKVAKFADAQKQGYSKLRDHYNDVSQRLRNLIGRSRHGAVADRLKHSAKFVNGVQEDLLATKQTIRRRLNQSTHGHEYERKPMAQR
jgi:hypothetical protein